MSSSFSREYWTWNFGSRFSQLWAAVGWARNFLAGYFSFTVSCSGLLFSHYQPSHQLLNCCRAPLTLIFDLWPLTCEFNLDNVRLKQCQISGSEVVSLLFIDWANISKLPWSHFSGDRKVQAVVCYYRWPLGVKNSSNDTQNYISKWVQSLTPRNHDNLDKFTCSKISIFYLKKHNIYCHPCYSLLLNATEDNYLVLFCYLWRYIVGLFCLDR